MGDLSNFLFTVGAAVGPGVGLPAAYVGFDVGACVGRGAKGARVGGDGVG